jgi:uncharacterized membrane protein
VAALWAVGFRRFLLPVRFYAAALGLFFVGGLVLTLIEKTPVGFVLLANARCAMFLLVAVVYLAAARAYHCWTDLAANERWLNPFYAVLGTGLIWITLMREIIDWYRLTTPTAVLGMTNIWMVRQATFSIVSTLLATGFVAAGFAFRWPTLRRIGLIAFLPIVVKVFVVDLSTLTLMPRVLALVALGGLLMGVSWLYQRWARRLAAGQV